MQSWLVYILRCRDGSLYTGITNDLPKRLKAHAAGKASRYTRSRLPVTLAYTEPQPTKSRALKREAAIKRLSRQAKVEMVSAGGPIRESAMGTSRAMKTQLAQATSTRHSRPARSRRRTAR